MKYYPYFRGKQYELSTITESVHSLKDAGFVPIIEPVKASTNVLKRTLNTIRDASAKSIVIVNPQHGDFSNSRNCISSFLKESFSDCPKIFPGVLLSNELSIDEIKAIYSDFWKENIAFIHAGFSDAKSLFDELGDDASNAFHIFHEESCGKLYQNQFNGDKKILLRDGFKRRINRDHPKEEFFSELHATFEQEGMSGFGDFLIVGDAYSQSGGPAYAVAIHLTFIDSDKNDEMRIYHFKSIRQNDPLDPAGKFAEALDQLIQELNKDENKILRTEAVIEFIDLHKRGHFPGLGYVKKLSMKHHIDILADYLKN